MAWKRASRGLAIGIALVGTLVISGFLTVPGRGSRRPRPPPHTHRTNAWTTPRPHRQRPPGRPGAAQRLGRRRRRSSAGTTRTPQLSLSFNLPLRDRAGLDRLIAQESRTHRYVSRQQIYDRFVPPRAQYDALRNWLQGQGFTVTHVGADRLALSASAPTSVVERALHVTINDYRARRDQLPGVHGPELRFLLEHRRADRPRAARHPGDHGPQRPSTGSTRRSSSPRRPGRAPSRRSTVRSRSTRRRSPGRTPSAPKSGRAATSRSTSAACTTSRGTGSTAPARPSASRCGRRPSASRP